MPCLASDLGRLDRKDLSLRVLARIRAFANLADHPNRHVVLQEIIHGGPQDSEGGWGRTGENLIILASDRDHGCLLPINLAESHTVDKLISRIMPLTSIR